MSKTNTKKAAPKAVSSEYVLTKAGDRLNCAFAALQDATDGISARERGKLEEEFYDAVRYLVQLNVRRFQSSNAGLREEYLQVGMLGAVQALKNWDRTRGSASTVVRFAVRRELFDAVRNNEYNGMSRHDFAIRGGLIQESRRTPVDGEEWTPEDLAANLDLSLGAVKRVQGFTKAASLDAKLRSDSGTEFSDMLVGEQDVPISGWTADADRLLLLKALTMVSAEQYDPISDFIVVRALGLDGETPGTFPQLKRMLGRTNVESLRLRAKRRQDAIVAMITDNPVEFGLTDEDVTVLGASTVDNGDDPEMDALTTLAQNVLGGQASTYEVKVAAEILMAAYNEQEMAQLLGIASGSTDAPEPRFICPGCSTPNDPRRVRALGCVECHEKPGERSRLALGDLSLTAGTLQRSRAWQRKIRAHQRNTRKVSPVSDKSETLQLF